MKKVLAYVVGCLYICIMNDGRSLTHSLGGSTMNTYRFFSDPSHGWLRVPVKKILELGIANKITRFSYVSPSGKYVYLEEDLDAGTFIDALCQRYNMTMEDLRPFIKHNDSTEKHSGIRSYQSFSSALIGE
jgi:hypothetical protein